MLEPRWTPSNSGVVGVGMSVYVVQYSFEAQDEGELSVNAGDTVTIIQAGDDSKDGWVFAVSGERTGYIPRDYVQKLSEPRPLEDPPLALGSSDVRDTHGATSQIQQLADQEPGVLGNPESPGHGVERMAEIEPPEEVHVPLEPPTTLEQAQNPAPPTGNTVTSHLPTEGKQLPEESTEAYPSSPSPFTFAPPANGVRFSAPSNTPSKSLTLTGVESMAISAASFDFDKMFDSHDRFLARVHKSRDDKLQQLDGSLFNNAQKIEECLGHNEMLAERLSTLQMVIEHEHQRWSEKLTLERKENQGSDPEKKVA